MKTVAETKQTAPGWSGSFNESDVVCVVSAFRLLLFILFFNVNMKELRDIDYELLYRFVRPLCECPDFGRSYIIK